MSASFSGTGMYTAGSEADIDNLQAGGFLAIVRIASTASDNAIASKSAGGSNSRTFFVLATGNVRVRAGRATTPCSAEATLTNFPHFRLGQWCVVAGVFDVSTAGNNKLYLGQLNGPLSEPTAYVTQTNGSGTVGNDSSGNLVMGNLVVGTQPFGQDMYGLIYFSGLPGAVELQEMAEALLRPGRSVVRASTKILRAYRFTDRTRTRNLGRTPGTAVASGTVTLQPNPHFALVDSYIPFVWSASGLVATPVASTSTTLDRRRRGRTLTHFLLHHA